MKLRLTAWYQHPKIYKAVKGEGVDTSWAIDDKEDADYNKEIMSENVITLQEVEKLIKDVKAKEIEIADTIEKVVMLEWKGRDPNYGKGHEDRIEKVEVSDTFPIWLVVDKNNEIEWILDGNHRLQQAARKLGWLPNDPKWKEKKYNKLVAKATKLGYKPGDPKWKEMVGEEKIWAKLINPLELGESKLAKKAKRILAWRGKQPGVKKEK